MADFNREQAEELLYKRMNEELNSFRNSLRQMTADQFLSNYNPYELIYKEDLLMCFEDDELDLSDEDVQWLLQNETPLDWLYQSWCDSSVSHMDMLREFIRDTVQTTREGSND